MKLQFFALFCALALIVGCTVPSVGEKNLVPSKADFVVTMKVADFFADSDVQDIMKEQFGDFEKQLEQAYDETGIDIKKMTKIIFFGESSSLGSIGSGSGYAAGIIYGQFDQAAILSKIKEKEELKEESYEGVALYVNDNGYSESAMAFVDGALVAGTTEAVKDVIDVSKGKAKALDDADLNAVTKNIDASGMLTLAAKIPEDARDQIARSDSRGSPINMQAFSKLKTIGWSFSKQGSAIDLKVAMLADDASSAGKVSDVLDGAISMGKGIAESGSAIETVLEKLKVESNGEIVKVSLSTTKDELSDLSKEIQKMNTPRYTAPPVRTPIEPEYPEYE
ncbi:hypothetical protein HY992_04140 [Candidatus Micrarchaeota archaeon]|nr:hypothetical protein [Candidatus Micrarchaeota archaeon]